jgi:hypothetical protein
MIFEGILYIRYSISNILHNMSSLHKTRGITWVAVELLASKEGLCFTQLSYFGPKEFWTSHSLQYFLFCSIIPRDWYAYSVALNKISWGRYLAVLSCSVRYSVEAKFLQMSCYVLPIRPKLTHAFVKISGSLLLRDFLNMCLGSTLCPDNIWGQEVDPTWPKHHLAYYLFLW